MKNFIYSILFLSVLACQTEGEEIIGTKKPKLLWETLFQGENDFFFSMTPVIGQENIVFSIEPIRGTSPPLIAMDKHTGKIRWKWDQIDPDSRGTISNPAAHLHNGILAYIPRVPAYGVDMADGSILWQEKPFPYGKNINKGAGETILHLFKEESTPHKNGDIHLNLINVESGARKIGYSIKGSQNWSPRMSNFLMRLSPTNDTLLYMMGVLYNIDERLVDPYLIGYNLSQDKILFEYKDEQNYGFLQLYEDKLIMANYKKMICYSADTGTILWEIEFSGFGLDREPLIQDGKLLTPVKSVNEERLRMYELSSRKVLWESNNLNVNSRMIMHKGMIYAIVGSQLSGIRASDGELLWQIDSPHQDKHPYINFYGLIALDPVFDRIYVSDYLYAQCYQL